MIRVEPATEPWLAALAQGDDVFTARFGIAVVAGWAGFPEAIPAALKAARAGGRLTWGAHLLFDRDGALVGFGGWKGAPVDGTAELGYAVAPERRGRGIATAAVRQFVSQARAAHLQRVIAHTTAGESASTTVLRRCGFAYVGDLIDPHDGVIWRWELTLASAEH